MFLIGSLNSLMNEDSSIVISVAMTFGHPMTPLGTMVGRDRRARFKIDKVLKNKTLKFFAGRPSGAPGDKINPVARSGGHYLPSENPTKSHISETQLSVHWCLVCSRCLKWAHWNHNTEPMRSHTHKVALGTEAVCPPTGLV